MKVSFKGIRDKVRNLRCGPTEFGSRKATQEGPIMNLARKKVITIQKENTIKHAADLMAKHDIRRLFVAKPNGTLTGVLTAKDILNFLGGGEHFKIVQKKHFGNLQTAMNEPVRRILKEEVKSISKIDRMSKAIDIMRKTGIGGLPVLENGKVIGVVTERDFARLIAKQFSKEKVSKYMSKKVIFGSSGMTLSDVAKVMVRNGFRRIPILENRELAGIITSTDLVKAFSRKFTPNILETRISKFMKKPVTASPEDYLADAAALMSKNRIGGLPVVKGKKVVGMLTERDLIRAA